MSRVPREAQSALRKVSHDVRASLGVLFPAMDELEYEAGARGALDGRMLDLVGMMRRTCRRLELLAETVELAAAGVEQEPAHAPVPLRVDLCALVREAVPARMAAERSDAVIPELVLPEQAHAVVVAPWVRHIVGEALAFAARRARRDLRVTLEPAADAWELVVSSDAPAPSTTIGPPLVHPLGLALELARHTGGHIELEPGETVVVRVRLPGDTTVPVANSVAGRSGQA